MDTDKGHIEIRNTIGTAERLRAMDFKQDIVKGHIIKKKDRQRERKKQVCSPKVSRDINRNLEIGMPGISKDGPLKKHTAGTTQVRMRKSILYPQSKEKGCVYIIHSLLSPSVCKKTTVWLLLTSFQFIV